MGTVHSLPPRAPTSYPHRNSRSNPHSNPGQRPAAGFVTNSDKYGPLPTTTWHRPSLNQVVNNGMAPQQQTPSSDPLGPEGRIYFVDRMSSLEPTSSMAQTQMRTHTPCRAPHRQHSLDQLAVPSPTGHSSHCTGFTPRSSPIWMGNAPHVDLAHLFR